MTTTAADFASGWVAGGHPSAQTSSARRAIVIVAIASCVGILASCGGGDSNAGSTTATGTKGPGGSSVAPSSAASGGSNSSNYSRKLAAKVRVVNVYSRSGRGEKIDVWAGSATSGKKLGAVDYGVASDPLTPLASQYSQAEKVDGKGVYSYMISFYTEGGTDQKTQVAQQSERAFPGDELTIVVGPGLSTPQSFAPAAGSDVVLFTKTENTSGGGGALFAKTDTPAGKALVYVNASGVSVGGGSGSTSTSSSGAGSTGLTFDVGQEGQGCLPEVGPQAAAPGDTLTRRLVNPQSTGGFFYVVSAGAQKLNLYGATDAGCKGQPIAGPFELNAGSGDHVGLLVYGPADNLKSMSVPL